MSKVQLAVSHFFDGIKHHENVLLGLNNGLIESIDFPSKPIKDRLEGLIMPGLIDLQVNGGGGYLFNDTPNLETLRKIAQAHQQFGTTAWLPTLITDSIDKMQLAADAISEAMKFPELGIIGIHFEGPHISKLKKGVHCEAYIRSISESEWRIYQRKDIGKIMVTLAPECIDEMSVKKLRHLGVVVAIGHSKASYETTQKVVQSGATGFTHLYNAMSGLGSREPGVVGAALASDAYLGIILDGIHCHPASAKIAYVSNPKLVLVTDAMPPVGSDQNCFEFFGGKIEREGLKLTDSCGRLAGSALDMFSAMKNAMKFLNIDLATANQLASRNPAQWLNTARLGNLKEGSEANMILLDSKQQLESVWVKAIQVK